MPLLRSPRIRSRSYLQVEELEPRLVLSSVPPTGLEEELIERLNDIRANPAAYGQAIGLDLSGVAPSQPLAVDGFMTQAAEGHSQDMNVNNYFAHVSPTNGTDPFARVTNAGFNATAVSESIAAGFPTPEAALQALIVDNGEPDLGHRMQLLALDSLDASEHSVGAGIVLNGSGTFGSYYTIDTALATDTRAFLTGAAFKDTNGNGLYDAGEGLGGVTVTVAGVGSVQTFSSGGYSIPLSPGTYTVTFSGGGLATQTTSVTVGAQNVRIDFTQNGLSMGSVPTGGGGGTGGATLNNAAGQIIAVGADAGGGPLVNVYNARTDALITSFNAFAPTFTGGVRVAVADVNGDGVADVICGAGPGAGPEVRVFDGKTFQMIRDFFPLPTQFTGGVWVAAGDVNGDGKADIVTSADKGGGPQVTITDGNSGGILSSFFATAATFTGGIRVACADINGDGFADVIAAAGPGGGPQVTLFDGRSLKLLTAFFALPPTFSGGLFIAAGDVNGDGRADIICGAAPGGGPEVSLFNGPTQTPLGAFFAYIPTFTGGVRVAAGFTASATHANILTAAGPGGGPQVSVFDGLSDQPLTSFFGSVPTFTGGVFVGAF